MFGVKPYGQLQYRDVNGKQMAYVDEGDGDAIVFAHGNPTSSYVWRNVMPHLEGLGRLVAADMIGMGGSGKLSPSGSDRYNYAEQRDYLFALWDALDLGDKVTLVLQIQWLPATACAPRPMTRLQTGRSWTGCSTSVKRRSRAQSRSARQVSRIASTRTRAFGGSSPDFANCASSPELIPSHRAT